MTTPMKETSLQSQLDETPKALVFSWQIPELTGFTVRHIRRLEKNGTFPMHIRLGARRIAWDAKDIYLWQKGMWRPTTPS